MKVAIGFDHAGVPFNDVVLEAVRAAGHEPVDVGTQDDYPDTAACKLPGIRAAVGHDTYTAAQCVQHDDCNVLALGARVIGPMVAASCVRAFVGADFSGQERHMRRLGKIDVMEKEGFGA
jgi:ribose 5-phosphate isomerase B